MSLSVVQTEEKAAPEVMTLGQVAALLQISPRTVARLAVRGKRGGIPTFRVGRSVRVRRVALELWMKTGTAA